MSCLVNNVTQKSLQEQEAHVYRLQHTHGLHESAMWDLMGGLEQSPNTLFDVKCPDYTEEMDLEGLLRACEQVCNTLDSTIKIDALAVPTSKGFQNTSTVRRDTPFVQKSQLYWKMFGSWHWIVRY